MTVQSIHHISIAAPSAVTEQVKDFYQDMLGLEEGPRPDFGIPGYWLYQGDHPMIHLIATEREGGSNGHFDHFALRCSGIDEIIAKLEQHGVKYGIVETAEIKQTQVFVTDPAGISLELNFYDESRTAA